MEDKEANRTKLAFVVNGSAKTPMAYRARAFAQYLRGRYDIAILYRKSSKLASILTFAIALLRFRPRVCYVLDIGYSGIFGAAIYKMLTRGRLVVDTGDVISALAVAFDRGVLGRSATRLLESFALAIADRVVVRGTFHKEWLAERGIDCGVIQDGVEIDRFEPLDADDLRKKLHLQNVLTVGFVGTMQWSSPKGIGHGWDLVELIHLLKDHPVIGLFIGDGSGVSVSKDRCKRYGIEEKVRFLGRIPFEELPLYLNVMDVCLSTQTNDLVGRVRTTGKLPLYMACGRYILASRVGEATLVLPEEMLVDYVGDVDPDYPKRLSERITTLMKDRSGLDQGRVNVSVARERFGYSVLAQKVERLLEFLCR